MRTNKILVVLLLTICVIFSIASTTTAPVRSIVTASNWTTLAPSGNAATDTANLRAAVAKGNVSLSSGDFLWDGSGTEFLLITKPIQLVGTGMGTSGTRLVAPSTVTNSQDWIRIYPVGNDYGGSFGSHNQAQNETAVTPLYGGEGLKISGISLVVADDSAKGRHGIHFDFTDTHAGWLSQCEISNCLIRARGGVGKWGIYLNNPYLTNAFFASTFERNKIWGGIYMYRAGDSINIHRNQITGDNYAIFADHLVPGASMLSIVNNNLTGYAGIVKLDSAPRTEIKNNNAELYPAVGYKPVAMYEITSSPGYLKFTAITSDPNVLIGTQTPTIPSSDCQITGNLGGVWTGTSIYPMNADVIKLTSASGTYIDNNQLYTTPYSATKYGINITRGASGTIIGKNNTKLAGTRILLNDQGVGTVYQ